MTQSVKSQTIKLLAVGPLPPPPSGATVSFQVFCDEVAAARQDIQLDIIDTSPKRVKENTSIASLGNVTQAWRIVRAYAKQIFRADAVVIFGSNGFLLSLTPLLVILAKSAGKPCYIRSFGGSLDQFADNLMPILRNVLLFGFRWSDGLIVETRLLHDYFQKLLGEDVYYVPGYRPLPVDEAPPAHLAAPKPAAEPLRLVFLGWVRREKGVFVLLESLKKLNASQQDAIHCDIYGPIHPTVAQQFEQEVAEIACASYGGVLEPASVIETLRTYDALVFPSFYQGEGHPGVVIEAMAAGIPVITTQFRSIPEVVENGRNGLLVEPKNAKELHRAIVTAHTDREQLWRMAQQNWEERTQYEAHTVAPQILQPILAGLAKQAPAPTAPSTSAASPEDAQG